MGTTRVLVGIAIAFAGYDVLDRIVRRVDSLAVPGSRRFQQDLLKWVTAAILLGYVLLVETESPASIGAVPPEPIPVAGGIDGPAGLVAWWIGGAVGTVLLTGLAYGVYRRLDLAVPAEFVREQGERPAHAFLFTAITAGVTESLLFQAYPIERLAILTGDVLVAALASWLVFTLVHYSGETFSAAETLYVGVPAFALTALYVLSGSIYVVVGVHVLVDAVSFLSSAG